MVHRNARLTPAGRRILVQRVCEGQPVAHVAKDMGVSRTCAQRYAEHARSMPAVAGRMWTPRRQALPPSSRRPRPAPRPSAWTRFHAMGNTLQKS
ncbi:leucine zipper domain-containing protein [Gordonia terrae]|nr:leucine zipper domain-containing protein [Gordonia terrae]